MFSVFITHNSKIREFSDGNKKLETELCGAKQTSQLWVPPFLSYELWKQSYKLWKSLIQTTSKEHGLMKLGLKSRKVGMSQTKKKELKK